MKNLLIVLALISTSSLLANELAWVDEQVEAIKPSRVGMSNRALSQIKNPFVYLKKEETKVTGAEKKVASLTKSTSTLESPKTKKPLRKSLKLSLIMNSSALINEKWYKKGDRVDGYEVRNISNNSVLLMKKKKRLLLTTRSTNASLKFNN